MRMFDLAFINRHKAQIGALRDFYRSELLRRLVPFWEARIVDSEYGGFFACFDTAGYRLKDVKPGWFVGRNIYTFANLYNEIEKRREWLEIAGQGVDWLLKYAHQGDFRFNSLMDRNGRAIDASRSIFNDAFSVKGCYEYLAACGDAADKAQLDFVRQASDALFTNAENSDLMAEEGLPRNFRSHAVNFMMLLCAMESRQVFGDRYRDRLVSRLDQAMYAFADESSHAVFEYLDPDCRPCPEGVGRLMDPGHAFESCWFSMEAGLRIDMPDYIRRAGNVIDWILEKGWDTAFGGIISMCDIEGGAPEPEHRGEDYCGTKVDWNDKVWWAQAEALNALAMSALLNGNEHHFSRFLELHDYVDEYFRDPANGEWFAILDHQNRVLRADKGMENKGPYHVVRSAVLLYKLFDAALDEADGE